MKGAQEFLNVEPTDLIEMSKQGYFTIMLDENLRGLEPALEDDGFKGIVPPQGLKDDALKRKARGWAILTKNSQDFVEEAVRYDYDVIGIEDIKFIDDKPDRTNETVRKISNRLLKKGSARNPASFPVSFQRLSGASRVGSMYGGTGPKRLF